MAKLSIFNQSVPTDFPNVRPSLDLRFALAKELDPRITFTRGSTGTYFDANGIMKTAGVNEPRFDYDLETGQSLGLLIEQSRTNLITYSDIEGTVGAQPTNFGFAGGAPYGQTALVSTDVSIGPNGKSCKHTRGTFSDNNVGNIGGTVVPGSTYVLSVWVYIPSSQTKNFSGKLIRFNMESPGTAVLAEADTTITDRWQRVSGTCVPSTTSAVWVVRTTANAGSFFYTDCWQMELGSTLTSYIPTTTVTVTRSADNATMTGTNFSSWYNQNEGTILILTDKLHSGIFDGYRNYCQIMDSSGTNISVSIYTNQGGTVITNYGTMNSSRQVFDYQQINIGSAPTKFIIGQSINSKYSFFTSSKGRTPPQLPSKATPNSQNNTTPTNMTTLWIGRSGPPGGEINAHITRLTYYPIQITNQQLINLTY